MEEKFEIRFLEEAIRFFEKLEAKSQRKVLFNIDKARYINDPKLFKKLTAEI